MSRPIQVVLSGVFLLGSVPATGGAEVSLRLPLGRTAYQTNERIDLAVLRSDTAPLAANELAIGLAGADGSRLAFTFPVPAATVSAGAAQRSEHVHLNG